MENSISYVMLAGGKSSRMGVAKGLLKYRQTFWILEQLQRLEKTAISDVFIGLGHDYDAYFSAIPWLNEALNSPVNFGRLPIRVAINKKPELGPFSTLQTVLEKVPRQNDVLVGPVDIPLPKSEEIDLIIATKSHISLPAYNNKHGHPIKVAASLWQRFININPLSADARLDYQIKAIDSELIKTVSLENPDILLNLNSVQAWKSFIKKEK